jgi:hypothetical protein
MQELLLIYSLIKQKSLKHHVFREKSLKLAFVLSKVQIINIYQSSRLILEIYELDLEFLLLYLQIKLVRFTNQVAYWRIEKIRTLDRTRLTADLSCGFIQ